MIDVIQEEQIKLGYQEEELRLYYPLSSLNALLETSCTQKELVPLLKEFAEIVRPRLGQLRLTRKGERFCLWLSPQASVYVHEHCPENPFLSELVETVSRHGCTLEEILAVFHAHSSRVEAERTEHGEFDYLIYFPDGEPDPYRYCLSFEGDHATYHRFTQADYEELGFAKTY